MDSPRDLELDYTSRKLSESSDAEDERHIYPSDLDDASSDVAVEGNTVYSDRRRLTRNAGEETYQATDKPTPQNDDVQEAKKDDLLDDFSSVLSDDSSTSEGGGASDVDSPSPYDVASSWTNTSSAPTRTRSESDTDDDDDVLSGQSFAVQDDRRRRSSHQSPMSTLRASKRSTSRIGATKRANEANIPNSSGLVAAVEESRRVGTSCSKQAPDAV